MEIEAANIYDRADLLRAHIVQYKNDVLAHSIAYDLAKAAKDEPNMIQQGEYLTRAQAYLSRATELWDELEAEVKADGRELKLIQMQLPDGSVQMRVGGLEIPPPEPETEDVPNHALVEED